MPIKALKIIERIGNSKFSRFSSKSQILTALKNQASSHRRQNREQEKGDNERIAQVTKKFEEEGSKLDQIDSEMS